jgi:hypothetical protein
MEAKREMEMKRREMEGEQQFVAPLRYWSSKAMSFELQN